jgi:hypothetical protein
VEFSFIIHILIPVLSVLFIVTTGPILNTLCFVIVNFYSLVIGIFILICTNYDAHVSNTKKLLVLSPKPTIPTERPPLVVEVIANFFE